jgi:hypothetical protein
VDFLCFGIQLFCAGDALVDGGLVVFDVCLELRDGAGFKELLDVGREIVVAVVGENLRFQRMEVLNFQAQFLQENWVIRGRRWSVKGCLMRYPELRL